MARALLCKDQNFSKRMFPKGKQLSLVEQINQTVPRNTIVKRKSIIDCHRPNTISKLLAAKKKNPQVQASMTHFYDHGIITVKIKLTKGRKRQNDSNDVRQTLGQAAPEEKNKKPKKITWLNNPSVNFPLPFVKVPIPKYLGWKELPKSKLKGALPPISELMAAKSDSSGNKQSKKTKNQTAHLKAPGEILSRGTYKRRENRNTEESPAGNTLEPVKEIAEYDPILHVYKRVPLYRIPGEKLWQRKRPKSYVEYNCHLHVRKSRS